MKLTLAHCIGFAIGLTIAATCIDHGRRSVTPPLPPTSTLTSFPGP